MARDHIIAPVFIPHQGCPYTCVFCSQKDITGETKRADRQHVENILSAYFGSRKIDDLPGQRELAFYGGTFTGLPTVRQEYLLSLVQPWIKKGIIQSIRLSTHSLFIDQDKLDLLKNYNVKTIELGVQSTDPRVLELSGREGAMQTLPDAVKLIRENNFKLGLQLMMGLPGDTEETFHKSVEDTIHFKPDFVRIYPALVTRHTRLHKMYLNGDYNPFTLERTVEILKLAVKRFEDESIPVIRVGLQTDKSLLDNLVAGPYHPALRYLVDSRICLDRMEEMLGRQKSLGKSVTLGVPPKSISIYTGHKRENIRTLEKKFRLERVSLKGDKIFTDLTLVN